MGRMIALVAVLVVGCVQQAEIQPDAAPVLDASPHYDATPAQSEAAAVIACYLATCEMGLDDCADVPACGECVAVAASCSDDEAAAIAACGEIGDCADRHDCIMASTCERVAGLVH